MHSNNEHGPNSLSHYFQSETDFKHRSELMFSIKLVILRHLLWRRMRWRRRPPWPSAWLMVGFRSATWPDDSTVGQRSGPRRISIGPADFSSQGKNLKPTGFWREKDLMWRRTEKKKTNCLYFMLNRKQQLMFHHHDHNSLTLPSSSVDVETCRGPIAGCVESSDGDRATPLFHLQDLCQIRNIENKLAPGMQCGQQLVDHLVAQNARRSWRSCKNLRTQEVTISWNSAYSWCQCLTKTYSSEWNMSRCWGDISVVS